MRPLTPREKQILSAMSTGARTADAAKKLGVCKRTADFHLRNAYIKLEAHNLVSSLYLAGFIKQPDA